MSERLFKVLGERGLPWYGGMGRWSLPIGKRPGKWMPAIQGIELCKRGYHLCRESDLLDWPGPVIYEAEYRGERVDAHDKIVVSEARLLRRLSTWNETTARLFAADCAWIEARQPLYWYMNKFALEVASAAEWDAARYAVRDAQTKTLMDYLYPEGK